MNTFACPSCDIGALGLSVSPFRANYDVTIAGQHVNAGEVFTEEFLETRSQSSVRSLAGYISDGSGTVHPDGSLTVERSGNVFRVAPKGSVKPGRVRQLLDVARASPVIATGSPTSVGEPATAKVAKAASPDAAPAEDPERELDAGTPEPNSAIGNGNGKTSALESLLSGALTVFTSREKTKQVEAEARAAQQSTELAPPTAPAQGAATNTAASFGQGFDPGYQAPRAPTPSPTLPPAPPPVPESLQTPLPVSGPVIQPSMLQGTSPTTGLRTPVFPGLPATEETGDGKVKLNAASFTALMDETSREAMPPPPPPPSRPFYTDPRFLGAAAVGLGVVLILNRRKRGRRRR